MTEVTNHRPPERWARWAPILVLGGLILFHAINNWIWLNKNVMTRGWDRAAALVNSLYYNQTLSHFSFQTLFTALTQDQIRPPLFGLSMALMYKPFGTSPDVAVMVNSLYLVMLVLATYGIGARLRGRSLGMLAAVLVSLTPLLFAMSRYSYFEFSLTAFVILSIYLLLASQRFEKRGYSLILGVSLGLGVLIKRTFPIFVLGALMVVVLQAKLPGKLWTGLRARPRLRWRDLGLAIVGGGLLSALWVLPNSESIQSLPAGSWLFALWWIIAAIAIFLLLQPPGVVTNFFTCCAVALALASLWYLPHSDFINRALRAGWGVNDPRGRTIDLLSPSTYVDYVKSIVYAFSPFYILLLLLAGSLLLIYLIRRRRRFLPEPWWDWNWWCILVSLLLAYGILSTSIYKEHRAITPLLPFLGIILAGILMALPWRRLRGALIVLAIGFGFVQYFAISYTGAHALVQWTNFSRPLLGQKGLFAQGQYLEVPDSGLNDPGYYIAGDVLRRVEATRLAEGWETISLGVLAGSSHVHVGMFAYDQILHYPAIESENPVQAFPDEPAYDKAFGYDYVVVLSEGSRGAAVREAVDLILGERRSQFEQAFKLEKVYPLPDGSEVYLYRRRARPSSGHTWSESAACHCGERSDQVIKLTAFDITAIPISEISFCFVQPDSYGHS